MTAKTFTERLHEMLAVTLLRQGVLVSGTPYTVPNLDSFYRPDPKAYRRVGLTLAEERPGSLSRAERPSLTEARCQTCGSDMAVVDVRETQSSRFGGTFHGDERFTHAIGRLLCSTDASHGRAEKGRTFFSDELHVVLDSTLGEAVASLDALADELGY